MAKGSTHKADSIRLAVTTSLTSVGLVFYGVNAWDGLAVAAGNLAGMYLTPDLDVNTPTVVDGLPFGSVVRTVFRPYSWMVPHRSPLSHWPVVGTVGRQLYLALVLLAIGAAFPNLGIEKGLTMLLASPLYWLWVGGLMLSDTFHWIRDWG